MGVHDYRENWGGACFETTDVLLSFSVFVEGR